MIFSEYLVDFFASLGVTDAFGIPGGVLMEIVHVLDRSDSISLHLNYHEQAAAYAACGFAQRSGRPCLAYATKGPGICNMITSIVEAYVDSIPVIFLTAHSGKKSKGMRVLNDQEIDFVPLLSKVTKYAVRIDNINNACEEIQKACIATMTGRKGPVFIDISSKIFKEEVKEKEIAFKEESIAFAVNDVIKEILVSIQNARKPVLLIGDGIKQANVVNELRWFVEKNRIPVLSSRYAQDVLKGHRFYYGYIGSHATRYSNFILSKSDLIISLGNRMAYPTESLTFGEALAHKKIIRLDVDESEFVRKIPDSIEFEVDLKDLILKLKDTKIECLSISNWINICDTLKNELWNSDVNIIVSMISGIIEQLPERSTIVSDIGNNELWLSRAYAYSKGHMFLCHSKSFKTVGCALPKSIGVFYATQAPVACFLGDQGFQFNIQELQYIASNRIPVKIIIINNSSSGMLRDFEKRRGYSEHVQTTFESGYTNPDFKNISKAYGINYVYVNNYNDIKSINLKAEEPLIIELHINDEKEIVQYIPHGNACYEFEPQVENDLFNKLLNL